MELAGKKVLVIGAARSGIAAREVSGAARRDCRAQRSEAA